MDCYLRIMSEEGSCQGWRASCILHFENTLMLMKVPKADLYKIIHTQIALYERIHTKFAKPRVVTKAFPDSKAYSILFACLCCSKIHFKINTYFCEVLGNNFRRRDKFHSPNIAFAYRSSLLHVPLQNGLSLIYFRITPRLNRDLSLQSIFILYKYVSLSVSIAVYVSCTLSG